MATAQRPRAGELPVLPGMPPLLRAGTCQAGVLSPTPFDPLSERAACWIGGSSPAQVSLVRALLHRPSVLLLDRIGGNWTPGEQQLRCLLEAFLACDGDIDGMIEQLVSEALDSRLELSAATSSCVVVWCAPDPVLASCLQSARDLVLTIQSPSRAALGTVSDVFPKEMSAAARTCYDGLASLQGVRSQTA